MQLGDVEAAVALFNRIISIDPKQDTAHKALGVIFGKTGDLNGSAVSHRSCVAVKLLNHECWCACDATLSAAKKCDICCRCGLGNTLVRHNLGYDAISAFATAIRIQPDVAGYHNNMASTCVRASRFRQRKSVTFGAGTTDFSTAT